jgi:hypothetical protein
MRHFTRREKHIEDQCKDFSEDMQRGKIEAIGRLTQERINCDDSEMSCIKNLELVFQDKIMTMPLIKEEKYNNGCANVQNVFKDFLTTQKLSSNNFSKHPGKEN